MESNRARLNWRKIRMSHCEKRLEVLNSIKKLEDEMLENVAASDTDENAVETDKQNISLSSCVDVPASETVNTVFNQDENSNFAETEISNVETTNDSDRYNREENLSSANCEDSGRNGNSDKDIASDKKNVTNKDSLKTVDVTQNIIHLPKESMHYVYKKNNERSNLQEFLRKEAMKNIHTIIAGGDGGSGGKQTTTALNTSNILDTEKVTEKVIGAISRPKSLAIERIDNMTAAQANKLKVMSHEYGMTPNNNEFNTIITDEQGNTDRTYISNQTLSNVTRIKERNTDNTRENANNNISTLDIKFPDETATVNGPTDNDECSDRTNNINNEAQEPISNAQQQQYADTPMSCTTENFTTLSTHTPLSQVPNSDDMFALNVGQEVSSFSDITKSITEETCFESPMNGNFKLPNLFGVSPVDLRSSTAPSSLTIADVEMIDHTSLQVYLEKSIIIPLQIQTRLMNNAIIKYLVDECNMLSHLRSLRSYFFLLNGEFAKSLTDSLYSRLYTISAPIELFNSATLTNLLEKALMNSFSNNYANSELLSLSAVDKPCQLYVNINFLG